MQVAVCGLVPVFMTLAILGALYVMDRSKTIDPEAYALRACTGQLAGFDRRERNGQVLTPQDRERKELIEIYIAEHLRDAAEEAAIIARRFPAVNSVSGQQELAARALAKHQVRSPERVKEAEAVVAKLLADQSVGLSLLSTPRALLNISIVTIAFGSAVIGVLALIGSLVARGGFTFRSLNVALVRRDGRHASRLRAAVRVIVAWAPIAVACFLITRGSNPATVALPLILAQLGVVAIFVAGAVWAILHPERAIQDRVAGTWLVPR
jgi:hypothetical protein